MAALRTGDIPAGRRRAVTGAGAASDQVRGACGGAAGRGPGRELRPGFGRARNGGGGAAQRRRVRPVMPRLKYPALMQTPSVTLALYAYPYPSLALDPNPDPHVDFDHDSDLTLTLTLTLP